MKILREADAKGMLENVKKWQEIDLDKISLELEVLDFPQKIIHLKLWYPGLARNLYQR